MGKKILFYSIILFVLAFMVMWSESAFARNMKISSSKAIPSYQYTRNRIGFGFNGIPFDGSHRAATQMRRAARGR